jgi:hemerythrin HHE cation binding domain-containing protein
VPSHDRDRAVALSRQLARAHQELRRRIDHLESGVDLPTHCLAFCAALTSHHQGEDTGMFVELLRERPDLAETVTKLMEDHQLIASILARVTELADGAAESPDPAIRRELDGLTAIMESHFRYEERAISEALDAGITDTGWPDQVFTFRDGSG